MIELFHYIHCPYCIRVRMALGYLKIPWTSNVLPYHDEKTPLKLTGQKMLPIIKDGSLIMNESLDIIKYLDNKNSLLNETWTNLDQSLDSLAPAIYHLAMPFWVHSAEFDPESQRYFLKKKEAKRGPFSELVKSRHEFESIVLEKLKTAEIQLKPFFDSPTFTIKDIALAAQVWGLFAVPEFQFNQNFYDYLMRVKLLTAFNYTDFFWRNP